MPEEYSGKAEIIKGPLSEVLLTIKKGVFENLYIDGGVTVHSFLKEDLIDEMIITTIPILLGGGTPLFANLPEQMEFECIKSKVF